MTFVGITKKTARQARKQGYLTTRDRIKATTRPFLIGVDEAGHGAWAGPMTVTGVVTAPTWSHPKVKDSKALSPKERAQAEPIIRSEVFAAVTLELQVPEINLYGMHRSKVMLTQSILTTLTASFPDATVVLDGDVHSFLDLVSDPCFQNVDIVCLPKADKLIHTVAAASILAKEHRDAQMLRLAEDHPKYGWEYNKGYWTLDHELACGKCGLTPQHRTQYSQSRGFQ